MRGSGYHGNERFGLAHERLAIMDPEGGKQPIVYEGKPNTLYARTARSTASASSRPSMDSQPPKQGQIPRYCSSFTDISGPDFVKELNGIFSFVCVGNDGADMIAARDHCEIKPLYIGKGKGGSTWFASELKAICDQLHESIRKKFPAGVLLDP